MFGILISDNLAQTGIPIGSWRTHLSYLFGLCISNDGSTIYCGTNQSLYSYNTVTNEFEKMTKSEGFSGGTVKSIHFHQPSKTLIISYMDSNIDFLINNDEIYNLPALKNKNIQGSKMINNMKTKDNLVIASCDFGILIIDMLNKVIQLDVQFNNSPTLVNTVCYDNAFFNGYYYFATSKGIYRVNENSNLKNFSNWEKVNIFPNGHYNNIEIFNNKLYLNYSGKLSLNSDNSDTLFSYDGFNKQVINIGSNQAIQDIHANNNKICILYNTEIKVFDTNINLLFTQNQYFTNAQQVTIDNSGDIWVVDKFWSMLKVYNFKTDIYLINGPPTSYVYDMKINNGILWAVAGGLSSNFDNLYNDAGIYYKKNDTWKRIPIADFGYSTPARDFIDIAVDPTDPEHAYVATWGTGLLEFKNFQHVSQLSSPPLDISQIPGFEYKMGGLAFDKNNNLWMSNSHTNTPLKVKRNNNTWSQYGFSAYVPTANVSLKVSVDALNNIWMAVIGKGILVFNPQTNQSRLLTNVFNQGDLPSTIVRCMTSDRNGEMWVGTNDGIRIFSPSQVFNNTNINGQKIVIKADDGTNELLLGETVITDIEVDGANRKWIATDGNGVRLVSENGRDIIYSFTAENSPLLSNKVNCIAIDHATGEVYFGTSLGIVSFRAEATEAGNSFGEVYAFPNPVKPDYNGVITITGMAEKSTVKITDVSGNLVYETESLGGQAMWDGKRFDGKRVQTGVYLVFCSNQDASETIVTKILFIN